MKMKKLLCVFLALMMLASFAGCSSEKPTDDGTTPDGKPTDPQVEKEVTELVMMVQTADVNAGLKAVVDYVNSKSAELGAKVVLEKIPDGAQGEQVVQVRYAGGEDVPDLLWFQPVSYTNSRLNAADNFVDLSANDYSDIYDDSYLRGPGYLLDGKLYNVPIATGGGTFMFYNRKVLEAAGVTKVPATWDELLAACEAVKKNGVTPVFYSGADAWTLQFFGLTGWYNDYAPEDATKFAEEMGTNKRHWSEMNGFIDSLKKTKELVDLGYVQETYLSDTYQQAQSALLDGTCAFYPCGDFVLAEMKKIDPAKTENDIGAFMIPLAENMPMGIGATKGIYVSKAGKNPELAVKVLEAMVSIEAQKAFFSAQGGIPLAKGVEVELNGVYADMKHILDTAVLSPQWTDFCKYHQGPLDVYISEMLVGSKTAEDVAAALDKDFEKAAVDAGDPNWK